MADFGFTAYDVDRYSDPFVFISYKSEDAERVGIYAKHLHDSGINVWYDSGLHAGSDWESYLMSVIEKPACKAVLLFVSANVADSSVIPLETTQARACKKPTVAVYLEPGLDLEVLLNKAIKVYVSQRQSVNAYGGTEEKICAELLSAAKNAMENTQTASPQQADQNWNNGMLFLQNSIRSRSEADISKARSYFSMITEHNPADYRGWLGLAMCECAPKASDLDSALEQLNGGAKYYSYVVSAGADNEGSPEYTRFKNGLWRDILLIMRCEFDNAQDSGAVKQFHDKAVLFSDRFGHTEPGIKREYDALMTRVTEALDSAAQEQAPTDLFELEALFDSAVRLNKYIGTADCCVVPDAVDGRTVCEIGEYAFSRRTDLVCVTLPDGIRKIGNRAFWGCSSLKIINLPDGLLSIGEGSFSGCSELEEIVFPDSIRSVGDVAFLGCSKLTIRGTGGLGSRAKRAARRSGVKFASRNK